MSHTHTKKLRESLRVGIVGGTADSLALGLLLKTLDCDVHIYEKSVSLPLQYSKGIWIDKSIEKCLKDYLKFTIDHFSEDTHYLKYLDENGYEINKEHEAFQFANHGLLFKHLYECFDNDHYHLNSQLTGFTHFDDKVGITLKNGEKEVFDLLICLEGPESFIRSVLLPDVLPKYAGYIGLHGLVQIEDLNKTAVHKLHNALTYQTFSNSHIVSHPVLLENDQKGIQYSWFQNIAEGDELNSIMTGTNNNYYNYTISGSDLHQKHKDFLLSTADKKLAPEMRELIYKTNRLNISPVFDLEVPQMVYENIILMGNTAFYPRPHAGMEMSKAITDALELVLSLLNFQGNRKQALSIWEAKRMASGKRIVNKSARMGNRSQFENSWIPGDKSLNLGITSPI